MVLAFIVNRVVYLLGDKPHGACCSNAMGLFGFLVDCENMGSEDKMEGINMKDKTP